MIRKNIMPICFIVLAIFSFAGCDKPLKPEELISKVDKLLAEK